MLNTKGARKRMVLKADAQKSLKQLIALRDIASVGGIAARWMKPRLDARGIVPIAPYRGIGRLYDRRSDLDGPAPG